MRSAPHMLPLLTAAGLLVPHAAVGQQGTLPWRPGDAPPAVAGLQLGALRSASDSLLGQPEEVTKLGLGVQLLVYRTRGIALVHSEARGLEVAYLISREAGDVGGTRVGDSRDSVVARWGDPTESEDNIGYYGVGDWVVVVRLDATRNRVELLGVGRAAEQAAEAEGPYDATANARQDIEDAVRESQRDQKLVLLDFGANWCLDCLVLDRLFRDTTVAGYLHANFRVVHVDVGSFDRNLDVSETYGNPIANGVPAVVVLSPSGEVIASTKDGSLASARMATAQQILQHLQAWVAAAHR